MILHIMERTIEGKLVWEVAKFNVSFCHQKCRSSSV